MIKMIFSCLMFFIIGFPSLAYAKDEFSSFIGTFLLISAILFILFLITREFWCWYWKINERIAILREIRKLLKEMNMVPGNAGQQPADSNNSVKQCKNCSRTFPMDAKFCEDCGTLLKI